MIKTTFKIVICVVLIGCNSISENNERPRVQHIHSSLVKYFKDPVTNLCFVDYGSTYSSPTCVPCDSLKRIVLSRIIND